MFFEGAEKKLEIFFRRDLPSLRKNQEGFWHELVACSQARILSQISNEQCTAYLLSESSLFVYDHQLIMITCGRTQLVDTVAFLLNHYKKADVEALFYERKNEIFGHHQPTHFFDDVRVLRKFFKGRAVRFGEESENHIFLFHTAERCHFEEDDCTLEVLMNGLQGAAFEVFRQNHDMTGKALREHVGLDALLDGWLIDDYVFKPVGYSLNALKDGFYATIHVTPENIGSYISFETNAALSGQREEWLEKILEVFRPRVFDSLMFTPEVNPLPNLPEYNLKREIEEDLGLGLKAQYSSYYEPCTAPERAFVFPED